MQFKVWDPKGQQVCKMKVGNDSNGQRTKKCNCDSTSCPYTVAFLFTSRGGFVELVPDHARPPWATRSHGLWRWSDELWNRFLKNKLFCDRKKPNSLFPIWIQKKMNLIFQLAQFLKFWRQKRRFLKIFVFQEKRVLLRPFLVLFRVGF